MEDVRAAARLLSRLLRRLVRYGFVTGEGARFEGVVAEVNHAAGQVAVASYLLAPGYFHDRATNCGADFVSSPLGHTTP